MIQNDNKKVCKPATVFIKGRMLTLDLDSCEGRENKRGGGGVI